MLTKDQKKKIVKDLTEKLKTGKVMIFSDFTGTTVGGMKELRDELRKTGATYKVTKKKLIDIAFKDAGIEADSVGLEGQIGLAIGQEDEVSAAKVLGQFSKKNKNFKILRGVLDNKIISDKEVIALASLPSREQLLAKFVGTINAPVSGFVNVLAGNLRNFVGVLKAIAETK
jgi:large subunit ribosomal protein L10